jgi:pimeloyl-ACP methyl ester carboxylesterase
VTLQDQTSVVTVRLADGRLLEVFDAGPEGGELLIMNHGTPGSGMIYPGWAARCANHGIRLASYSRPGYGRSTRLEGRSIADCAADVAAVADALGGDRFYVEGHSGGGARALACAALLPDRVRAAAVIAGAAPKDAEGFDWWAGNAEENLEEFRAAELGGDALRQLLEAWRDDMLKPSGAAVEQSLASLGSLVSPTDLAVVTPEVSAFQAVRRRHSIGESIWGWFDDDLSEMKPWGFEIASIRVPVSIWHGEDDRFVPASHAEWLMTNVPGATRHMLPGEGHWSIKERRLDEVLDDLADIAAADGTRPGTRSARQ